MKNPVAKHAHKFNRAVVEPSKKAYKRKEKHTKAAGHHDQHHLQYLLEFS